MDAAYLADAFGQALGLSRKWAAEQQRSESLFAALLDFHSRLRQLKIVELAAFGIGSDLEPIIVDGSIFGRADLERCGRRARPRRAAHIIATGSGVHRVARGA